MAENVDSAFASWLKADALYVSAAPDNAAAWPNGKSSEILSPIANRTDAQAEAARQAEFLKGPRARDSVVVNGLRKDLLGKAVTIRGDRLGYQGNGAVVFVISVAENDAFRMTTLNVIKRL